ncbi:MAG: GPP34 family phosphoprotein [Candidatus Ozemobacteraceae bacterium]
MAEAKRGPLSIAEEVVLLALDDDTGDFIEMPPRSLEIAITGGLLADLALANRIDSDLKSLILVDREPMGDPLYDVILDALREATAAPDASKSIQDWVFAFSRDADSCLELILMRLCDRGILKSVDRKFLWVYLGRRYPKLDELPDREVRARIRSVLLAGEMPDPRDAIIICLSDACGILNGILSDEEASACETRLDQICKLDLIGQAVSKAAAAIVLEIQASAFTMLPA